MPNHKGLGVDGSDVTKRNAVISHLKIYLALEKARMMISSGRRKKMTSGRAQTRVAVAAALQ